LQASRFGDEQIGESTDGGGAPFGPVSRWDRIFYPFFSIFAREFGQAGNF